MLTALLCLALDDRPLFLTDVTRLLFCQLPAASRRLLGVPGTAATERAFKAAYRRVGRRYCFHAIASAADPSALPKNRRLTEDQLLLRARAKPVTPGQATAARDRLEALVNALLEASISVLTQDERAACGGSTALDATPVPLFSRGPSRRTGLSASDPDGGWYVREGDHREREDDKGKPLRKICWALEATIATTARPPHAEPASPNLAIGLALTRPGEDPGGTGARVLASAAARGHKTGWLGYDRAYTQALPQPIPPPGPGAGLPAGHGLPRRPARHPGQQRRRPARRRQLVLPGHARTADHRHHQPARPRHQPRTSTTSRSPPAPPTSSNAKTARTPTATSAGPAPPSAPTPG